MTAGRRHIQRVALARLAKSMGLYAEDMRMIAASMEDRPTLRRTPKQNDPQQRAYPITDEVRQHMHVDFAVMLVDRLRETEKSGDSPWNVGQLRSYFRCSSAKLTSACLYARARNWVTKPRQKWELTDIGRTVDLGGSKITKTDYAAFLDSIE